MIQRRTTPRPKALWTQAFPKQLQSLRAASSLEEIAGPHSKTFTRSNSFVRSREPMRKISPKKARSDRLYNAMVKEWLLGRSDAIALALGKPAAPATCCHHTRGRLGTLKFDKRFWCPT